MHRKMTSQKYCRTEVPDNIPDEFAACSFPTESFYVTFKFLDEIPLYLFLQMIWADNSQQA